jgi:general secretion pathway protein C
VSNYVLTGVIASGSQGVAIIVADGGVPMALKIGRELAPGITLSEVYPRYVMLSDNGMTKRIDLAADSKAAAPMSEVLTAPVSNQPVVNGAQNVPEPPMAPGALQQPPMAPGALQQPPNMMTGQQAPMPQQGGQNPQQGPSQANPGAVVAPSIPPPNQIETPPPTRNFATPATQ